MGGIIYLRLKKNIEIKGNDIIHLNDIAYITGDSATINQIGKTFIYEITDSDKTISVIEGFTVVQQLIQLFPKIEIQLIGPTQSIINIKKTTKTPSLILVILIWLLLFIGASMAIMNFHYDVSMQEVQQKLHFLMTGEKTEYPLWIQVPYSLGLGVGMILFFNHLFKKRFNEEPSPLEIEMFKYQQDLDSYASYYQNTLTEQNNDTN
ncbi:stage V sporulation protein AA [Aquibacillus halophilus]|uniref:Stage V sporulation protein AA n=1 Tax=Aquibacillus halophilus TaxID=930132 RepID=A0A6A8DAK1_9BACI|nr:stage V sporulation protein AA [Aquibacillus halophilus]MRH42340.1 stage V sporulation protein AA [Aquibacillus halophilus]